MTKDYIVVHPKNIFSQGNTQGAAYDEPFEIVDMYDLANVDLTTYKCMIILGFVDQDFMEEEKYIVEQFLQDRKIVCFFGNLVSEWIPGQKLFIPKEVKWHGDYNISLSKPHPIFEGVTEEDMTINRGVKGFFARGHHPAPIDAEVLLTLPNGESVTYIDRVSTNGTIFMHAGNSFFNIGGMQPKIPKTTDRIPAQMMQWVQEEYTRLEKGERAHA